MTQLTDSTVALLDALQETIGDGNAARGFHDDAPKREDFVEGERGDRAFESAHLHYHGNLHMLMVSELVESHDEIRNGRSADDTYFVGPKAAGDREVLRKPEGVPSEIADEVIRCFDYAHRSGFSLGEIIATKLAYNATRPYKHGKKF